MCFSATRRESRGVAVALAKKADENGWIALPKRIQMDGPSERIFSCHRGDFEYKPGWVHARGITLKPSFLLRSTRMARSGIYVHTREPVTPKEQLNYNNTLIVHCRMEDYMLGSRDQGVAIFSKVFLTQESFDNTTTVLSWEERSAAREAREVMDKIKKEVRATPGLPVIESKKAKVLAAVSGLFSF